LSLVLATAADVFLVAGLLFVLSGVVGVLRLPDFYTRLHALGKCDTLGVGLMVAGLALRSGTQDALKMLLILVFIMLANPLATHALARAAWRSGVKPWIREGPPGGSERPEP
jgi:multicomponent Na+:H+ antiporter subunit G